MFSNKQIIDLYEKVRKLEIKIVELKSAQDIWVTGKFGTLSKQSLQVIVEALLDHHGLLIEPVAATKASVKIVKKEE